MRSANTFRHADTIWHAAANNAASDCLSKNPFVLFKKGVQGLNEVISQLHPQEGLGI